MKGKNLGCWCNPEPCHGDVLLELIDLYTKKPLNKNKHAHNNEGYLLNPNFLTKRNIPK